MVQTPLEISFQGCAPSDALRQMVIEQVDALERLYGRVTSCHVVIKVPDHHHRSGGHYEVGIHLTMPGNIDIRTGHAPTLDGRFADARFAVTDAFRRARRVVQDRLRRQRGDVKALHGRIERSLDEPPSE